jgi:hypothetical protein
MVACAFFGITSTIWIAGIWPDGYLVGRKWLLYAFAPLTAVSTLLSAVLWTRRLGVSGGEALATLLVAQIIAWCVVAYYYGASFGPFMFLFWAVANIVFAPWWLLGFWIGRAWPTIRAA